MEYRITITIDEHGADDVAEAGDRLLNALERVCRDQGPVVGSSGVTGWLEATLAYDVEDQRTAISLALEDARTALGVAGMSAGRFRSVQSEIA